MSLKSSWRELAVAVALSLSAMALTAFGASAQTPTPTAILPGAAQELPGIRIGWGGDLKAAVGAARQDGKPLVVLFVEDYCGWCNRLVANTLRCPDLNSLAGLAHFAVVFPSGNPDAKTLADRLGVTAYPAISALRITGSDIKEVFRIQGGVNEAELLENLATAGLTVKPGSRSTALSRLGTETPDACGSASLSGKPRSAEVTYADHKP